MDGFYWGLYLTMLNTSRERILNIRAMPPRIPRLISKLFSLRNRPDNIELPSYSAQAGFVAG